MKKSESFPYQSVGFAEKKVPAKVSAFDKKVQITGELLGFLGGNSGSFRKR